MDRKNNSFIKSKNRQSGRKSRLPSFVETLKARLSNYYKNHLRFFIQKTRIRLSRLKHRFDLYISRYKYGKEIAYGTITGIALLCLLLIVVSIFDKPVENNVENIPEPESDVVVFSTNAPSEEVVKEEEFFTEPSDPRLLTLPTINTDAYIQKVGVDQNNQIAVPNNIHLAGWYINSIISI